MTTIPVFIDTNAFIQMRDLKDIPWQTPFPQATRVEIIVTPPIIKELEDFKTGPNERRRERARAALSLIDQAMESETMAFEWKKGTPSVWLHVSGQTKIDEDRFPQLDLAKTDDQLVAHAATRGGDAFVFSHDRGPRISARLLSVKTLKPEDAWLLPPERSEKDRKIEQLERAARERYPKIVLSVGATPAASVECVVPKLPPLKESEVQRKMHLFLAEHPRAPLKRAAGADLMVGYARSQAVVDRYHQKYDAFEQAVRSYFERLHLMVRKAGLIVAVPYTVTNDSGIAAKGLRIETQIEGDAWLTASKDEARQLLTIKALPAPPEVPNPSSVLDIPRRHFDGFAAQAKPRDAVRFYWADRPKMGDTTASLTCEDYHARRSWNDDSVIIAADAAFSGSLRFHVTASNLPDPIKVSYAVQMVERDAEWDDPVIVDRLREIVRVESA